MAQQSFFIINNLYSTRLLKKKKKRWGQDLFVKLDLAKKSIQVKHDS